MKIKNAVLLDKNFTTTLRQLSCYVVPVPTALKILRLYAALESERKIVLESKNDLIRKYGVKDEKGGVAIRSDDKAAIEGFSRDLNILLSLEVELPFHDKIKLTAALRDTDGNEVHLSVQQVSMLTEIIDFETNE